MKEDSEDLKNILKRIESPLYKTIDLENSVMEKIELHNSRKVLISMYKKRAKVGLFISLIIICIVLFNTISLTSFMSVESTYFKYSIPLFTLVVVFFQLEMGAVKLFKTLK